MNISNGEDKEEYKFIVTPTSRLKEDYSFYTPSENSLIYGIGPVPRWIYNPVPVEEIIEEAQKNPIECFELVVNSRLRLFFDGLTGELLDISAFVSRISVNHSIVLPTCELIGLLVMMWTKGYSVQTMIDDFEPIYERSLSGNTIRINLSNDAPTRYFHSGKGLIIGLYEDIKIAELWLHDVKILRLES